MTPAKKQIVNEIQTQARDAVLKLKDRADLLLTALEIIPDNLEVYFGFDTLSVKSTDPKVFTKLAKSLGGSVRKGFLPMSKTGYLAIDIDNRALIYSSNITLPTSCEFKEVTETVTRLVPSGDCGSWFAKDSSDE